MHHAWSNRICVLFCLLLSDSCPSCRAHHAPTLLQIADVVARHGSIYVDACIILLSGLRLCAALLHVAAAALFMPRGSVIAAAGLHAGCQDAAADTFERVAHLKGAASGAVPVSAVVQSLQKNSKRA